MKKLISSLSFILLISFSFSQPVIEWQKCYGGSSSDIANDIIPDNDGGYIIVGYAGSDDYDVSGQHGLYDGWIIKIDSLGNIQWQRCIGGTDGDNIISVAPTLDAGYISVGVTSSNDGDISGNNGSNDALIVKVNNSGMIIWQKCFGGSNGDAAETVIATSDSGYFVGASATSVDGDVVFNHGGGDFWLLKLDSNGNLIWQKTYGGSNTENLNSIYQTSDGGLIMAGQTKSDDGDVVGHHSGFDDYWIVKLDSIGNIEWQKCLGGYDVDVANAVVQTYDGGFLCAGYSNSINGDVIGNHGSYDFWVVKLDSVGNIQWQNSLGGDSDDRAYSLIKTTDSCFVVAGNVFSSNGNIKKNNGQVDYWVLKIDTSGNVLWENTFGGEDFDPAFSVTQNNKGNYLMAGYTASFYGDVSGIHATSNPDYWIIQLNENYNSIIGRLFVDLNSNQIQDTNELFLSSYQVKEQTTARFVNTNNLGVYNFSVFDTGSFTIVPPIINYFLPSPANHNITFSALHQADSLNDFAFQPQGFINDLSIVITPITPFRTGFNASYQLLYKNIGTTTLSGTVIFFPDSALTYLSASVIPQSVTADSVVWSFFNLMPFDQKTILVNVNVSSGAVAGTLINSHCKIEPMAGDTQPGNNEDYWELLATASSDPNDITVNRDTLYTVEFPYPPYLDYLIRFQNTGNDTAFNVRVLNNISPKLDLNSFELVAASHPMNINYQQASRLMEFNFENILLPDSGANELNSNGFVRYRIKPIGTLVVGDSITNTAAIYFDFNQPVITNTAATYITVYTGINEPKQNNSLLIYPNPGIDEIKIKFSQLITSAPQIIVTDIAGRILLHQKGNISQEQNINVSNLSPGMYIVHVAGNNYSLQSRFVKE